MLEVQEKYAGFFPSKTGILEKMIDEICYEHNYYKLRMYRRSAATSYFDARLDVFAGEGHGLSKWGDRRMEAMMLYLFMIV